ncbi:MFS general substrate transporter [Lojkania enalia]|uniref:MFS general substrate transporter n=1 Tax=Lojkania enalia TaxID=147567 RepID=A0A9P4N0Z5_9PLEO|nr:MFS general substrate transporter [Didymosphaeria enalia]
MAFQFQSTVFGQLVRALTRNKHFRYPDEIDPSLCEKSIVRIKAHRSPLTSGQAGSTTEINDIKAIELQNSKVEEGESIRIVRWYGPDDLENPQNWPTHWKHLITFQLCFLNFAVYMTSSIYVPGEMSIIEELGISKTVAVLGLSFFTIGYGFGPMLWSPMSEMPKVGRSSIFFWTLLAFVLLQVPAGYATNIAMFLVFRLLTGFCGSPCLATGGGTIADMYSPVWVSYAICIWSSAGICGPVFGPIIGGFVAPARGWRWTIWVIEWLCSFVLILLFFFLPETSAENILYKRAKRLRKATGDSRLRSQSEIDAASQHIKDHLTVLARAFTLTFTEPIVLLMDLYSGLLYGILFIWFESFPIVFGEIYKLDTSEQGLIFLGIFVGALSSVPLLLIWMKHRIIPRIANPDFKPEEFLSPVFVGTVTLPICLFWYGWSARESIHWIMPTVGTGFFSVSVVTLFNSLFNYLGVAYPLYTASIFAGNALFRAACGAIFPVFARSLFERLGVGPGNSLLGGVSVCFIPIPFIFRRYGVQIRYMSKNARHDV